MVRNKEELLFVTGLRTFTARSLLSGDEHGAYKFKMERYLHDSRHTMASVFAPISYPLLPVLLFQASGRWPQRCCGWRRMPSKTAACAFIWADLWLDIHMPSADIFSRRRCSRRDNIVTIDLCRFRVAPHACVTLRMRTCLDSIVLAMFTCFKGCTAAHFPFETSLPTQFAALTFS